MKNGFFNSKSGIIIVFLIPAFILIGVFLIFPAFWEFYLSMTNESLMGISAVHPQFVGISNFIDVLTDPSFYNSLVVTFIFVLESAIIGQAGLGMLLSLLTYRKKIFRTLVQVVAVLAWIIPDSVVAYLWIAFLDKNAGTFNNLLALLGLARTNWFYRYPLTTIVIFNIWRGTAFSMLMFSAAFDMIPPSYLEVADVMGVSWWRKFKDIIFPNLKRVFFSDLILITLWTFNVFTPYLLTQGGPGTATEILPIYIYLNAFQNFKIGYGAAISVIVLLINLVLASVYFTLSKEKEGISL
ncbi:MAG: sugar ABC transporter permease [Candidatus Parvarchaeota archaeon]|nr:sugar ABC transporter permease [Candidatus Jingweiarchaeum tengchongense]MCW1305945.1 sugar ABC transporter permease [Candidatus Jingweiarchaeum tengchongense]